MPSESLHVESILKWPFRARALDSSKVLEPSCPLVQRHGFPFLTRIGHALQKRAGSGSQSDVHETTMNPQTCDFSASWPLVSLNRLKLKSSQSPEIRQLTGIITPKQVGASRSLLLSLVLSPFTTSSLSPWGMSTQLFAGARSRDWSFP